MGGTRKKGELARAKGAIKEALGLIVGDEEIRAEGVADQPNGKAGTDGDPAKATHPPRPAK